MGAPSAGSTVSWYFEAPVRLAEKLNVSIDHLLVDDIPPPPPHSAEDVLGDRLATITELVDDDLHLGFSFIDAFVTKNRPEALAGGSADQERPVS